MVAFSVLLSAMLLFAPCHLLLAGGMAVDPACPHQQEQLWELSAEVIHQRGCPDAEISSTAK